MPVQGGKDYLITRLKGSITAQHHQIQCRQVHLALAEAFPHQAFNAVPSNSGFYDSFADGQTQASVAEGITPGQYGQVLIYRFAIRGLEDGFEFFRL